MKNQVRAFCEGGRIAEEKKKKKKKKGVRGITDK